MDDLEHRVRQVLDRPTYVPNVETFLADVHRGARRRQRRRTAALATACALLVLTAGIVITGIGPRQKPQPTDEVTRITVGNGPCCVATVAGSVWVLNGRDQTLQRVDPVTDRAAEPVDVNAELMAPVGEHLLLVDANLGTLSLFDPATEKVKSIKGFASRGSSAFDGRSLWLGSTNDGELVEVDPASARILTRFTLPGVQNYDLMAMTGDQELWATTWDGELLRINLRDREVVQRTRPFPNATDFVGIAAAGDNVFAVSGGVSELLRIDQETGRITARRPLALTSPDGFPRLAQQPDGSLWLMRGPDQVDLLDPRTGEALATYRIPLTTDYDASQHFAGGIAIGFDSLWVSLWPDTFDQVGTLVRLPLDTTPSS
jgi:streptogramin lyase